ncbi:hypothetical protein [Shewanella colwelliana]|uniref:hypothetical protein n=1 Tax=Shewanella colwelliana TaxID=23 RepID=UPI0037352D2F
MNQTDELNHAIAALDKYGYDKKNTSGLEQARTHNQIETYLTSLDYNLRRLLILQEVVNKLVDDEKHKQRQQELLQTYRTKIIHLSREYEITFDQVVAIMQQQAEKR